MVFCTEGLIVGQLDDMKLIEETQMKYLTMLHRYLKDKYPNKAHAKLATGMFIIHDAKEAHEIHHNNRLPIWKLESVPEIHILSIVKNLLLRMHWGNYREGLSLIQKSAYLQAMQNWSTFLSASTMIAIWLVYQEFRITS